MGYRLIIADDEKKIIQLVLQLGHWEALGIEIIDECYNGEQALESILANQPDFVLSDIKMPVYDGVELIEKTRNLNIDTLFILLSGYRHFEYARSAIQLNVIDYLLKPIDEKQLNETLEKACKRIDQLREQKEKHQKLTELETVQEQSRLEKFWEWIIFRKRLEGMEYFQTEAICNKQFGTEFHENCYQIICIVSNLNGMLEFHDSFFSEKVYAFIRNCFSELGKVYFHTTYKGHIIILNFNENKKSEIKKAVSVLFYNIRDLEEIYGNFRLNFGCSQVKHSCRELMDAFEEAHAAEWGRLIFLGSNILEYGQVKELPRFGVSDVIDSEELSSFKNCVKYLREEELSDIFSGIYKRTGALNSANPLDMADTFFALSDAVTDCFDSFEEKVRMKENFFYNYLEAKNFQQTFRNSFLQLEKHIEEEHRKLKEKLGKPLGEAVRFMKMSYMNTISLEGVAEVSNVSATYLSKLFKEEMKIGFNEFLTQIRLEESQRLLSETNISVKEIAIMVGYNDEKYYSKLFKKLTGIKPTDYRKLYG